MNLQTLRYVVTIAQTGSLSKASQYLFVSQSTLSRSVKELEQQLGISLFFRTNQGVQVTHDGEEFISRANQILMDISALEGQYLHSGRQEQSSLLVATQRCYAVIRVLALYYQQYFADKDLVNMVIKEETTQNILQLVSSGTFGVGIFHYTSDQAEEVRQKCQELGLDGEVIHRSPVVAQVDKGHPLANRQTVHLEDLLSYPHITYNDENLTGIHYCSDIALYNPSIQKKRIVIHDGGTLRAMISHTDGYYIGCDYSNVSILEDLNRKYLPVEDVHFTLNTMWVKRSGRGLTKPEAYFLDVLKTAFSGLPR